MSFFEDKMEAWEANDYKGRIEDYDGSEVGILANSTDSHLNQKKLADAKAIVQMDNPKAQYGKGEDWLEAARKVATRDAAEMRKLYLSKAF